MNSHLDDDERALSRALHGRVDELRAAPLGLHDVQQRARVVRRRRRVAAGAAALAAVAVIVPTAVVATRVADRPGPGPATTTGAPTGGTDGSETTTSPTSEPTDPATPTGPAGRRPLDIGGLPVGEAPRLDWIDGNDVVRADGSTVPGVLPTGTTGFAPLGDGWVVATRDDQGVSYAQFVPADGVSIQQIFDLDGPLATSPAGEVVAFAQPDGRVRVMQEGGADQFDLGPVDRAGPYGAVAVTAENCREQAPEGGGCVVFVNTDGQPAQALAVSSHGIVDQVDADIDELTAWSAERYAGITERREDLTTCSVVRDSDSRDTAWETCVNRIMAFSPDGSYALGIGSAGSGNGEGQISLLDAADGTVLVDLVADEEHQVFASQWAWEDDSHALLVVREGLEWSVVRLGTDGSLELAVPPRRGDEVEPAIILQS